MIWKKYLWPMRYRTAQPKIRAYNLYNTLIFQVITLNKGDKGLGFSILDYQDPLNMSETVIVVRSLVPGGIAQLDGQIVPGDRILHVNQVRLEHVSLDTAVQALKG